MFILRHLYQSIRIYTDIYLYTSAYGIYTTMIYKYYPGKYIAICKLHWYTAGNIYIMTTASDPAIIHTHTNRLVNLHSPGRDLPTLSTTLTCHQVLLEG
jgi:hypothetical protein